jgi:2-keto-4-pentenoate hydratase/2-oxohepta-3-ene-1,7-dioic acid hydratase in catechol pathway
VKLATFEVGSRGLLGSISGNEVTSLTDRVSGLPADMISLIEAWKDFSRAVIAAKGCDFTLNEVTLRAPIPRPGKIFCIGLNYADHAAEAGIEIPKKQFWFTKPPSSVVGPFDPIERPAVSRALDYEAELVFVIGKRCKHVAAEDAYSAIFGYCAGNDVSVRDWQTQTTQVTIGKSFDTHAPFGPWIVTSDELDPRSLGIRSFVNGEKRQESNTRHLIFDCAAQLSHLSQAMTLEPGDIIYSGTPAGVAAVMKPPKWMIPGDRVRVEIDGIGTIENEVVEEKVIKFISDGALQPKARG